MSDKPSIVETLGGRIKRARKDAGLTQDQLAGSLSTTRQMVIAWEKGRHLPNRSSRERLAAAVGRPDLFAELSESDK